MNKNPCAIDAIISAQKLRQHLAPPTIHEFMTPPATVDLTTWPTLFARPMATTMQQCPSIVFSKVDFTTQAVPRAWLCRYIEWAVVQKRWQQFEYCYEVWSEKRESTRIDDQPVNNGAVAGLLAFLYALDADSILREFLISWAVTDSLGAYFLAEAHHLAEERPMIVAALERDPRLLYWLSHMPAFTAHSLDLCSRDWNLWAGLALAHQKPNEVEPWLEKLVLRASDDSDAASAALVLQPRVHPNQRANWVAAIKSGHAIQQAFDCLWWSRISWDPSDFRHLVQELRPTATADRAKFWFNWALQDLDWGTADFQQAAADPLWSVEFLEAMQQLNLRINDGPLRTRMVERLTSDHSDRVAPLVLSVLNRRAVK